MMKTTKPTPVPALRKTLIEKLGAISSKLPTRTTG
jgi:hypothetical protein